jgi:hypothetical protein
MDFVANNVAVDLYNGWLYRRAFAIILAAIVKSAPAGDEKCRRSPPPSKKAPSPTSTAR